MAETIEESVHSIMGQVDDEYEMVVVDGGSTDRSLEKLEELSNEYENLRFYVSRLGILGEGSLGHDRNVSIEKARGKYVLPQLDMDDYYFGGVIQKFVDFYHYIEDEFDKDFFCSGKGINIAPRNLMLKYKYKNTPRYEDKILWMELAEDNKIIWVEMPPACIEIKKDNSLAKMKKILTRVIGSIKRGYGIDWGNLDKALENVPRTSFHWRGEEHNG